MLATTPGRRPPLVVTRAGVFATLALFVVVAACVRLGFWQLDRHAQRRAANELRAQRAAAAPLTDPDALRDSAALAWRVATVFGEFDHAHTIVLAGRSYQGAPGVHLLTPLRVAGRPFALLVNRGWVPAPDGVTIDYDFFAAQQPDSVRGVLLPFPGGVVRGGESNVADGFARVWFSAQDARLRAQFPYPLLDMLLQVTPHGVHTTAPLPLPPPAADAGPHLGYAVQWFSFAVIGVLGWGALVLRRPGAGGRARAVHRE